MLHEKNGKKGYKSSLAKWSKMLWLVLRTIKWQKMRWEWVNTVSGFTHTKFQGFMREK